jgi:hypothetical protein
MLRIPHCQVNRLTNGGKIIIPTCRPRSAPQKYYFSASGTHFCLRLSKLQGLARPEGLGNLKKKKIIRLYFRLVAYCLQTHVHPYELQHFSTAVAAVRMSNEVGC